MCERQCAEYTTVLQLSRVALCRAQAHASVEIRHVTHSSSSSHRALYATGPILAMEQLAVVPLKLAVPIAEEGLLVRLHREASTLLQ